MAEPPDIDEFRWWRYRGRHSYPMKRSEFEAALDAIPLAHLRQVVLADEPETTPTDYFHAVGMPAPKGLSDDGFRPLASATWFGVDIRPSQVGDITIYAVPARDRRALSKLMMAEGMPRVLRWLHAIEKGPETGRTETRRFTVFLAKGRLLDAESWGNLHIR
jgi:hypothetical protein